MPTSARTSPGFFGQFADVGIRAPEQTGLLQKAIVSSGTRPFAAVLARFEQNGLPPRQRCPAIHAAMRSGPPLPPLIFIGSAMT